MPIRQGHLVEILYDGNFPAGYTYGSEGLLSSLSPSGAEADPGPQIVGLSLHTFPVTVAGRVRTGYVEKGTFDDVYNRIYVFPQSISVGNLAGSVTREVNIWNAYVSGSRTLSQAQIENDSGTFVTLPPGVTLPHEIPPLKAMTFVITIEMSGPASINGSFVLNIEGQEFVVPITGRRVVLFPFEPNWSAPVDETITISSWAIPAVDGSEQTGSTWGDNAARTFEYQTVLKNTDEMQLAENLLFNWQSLFFALPIWTEKRTLTASASSDALSFDTSGFSAEPGSLLVLWDGAEHNETKEVLSVSAGGVVLTAPLEETWPSGTKVYPIAVALMGAQVSGSRETTGVVRLPVMFECEPSATPDNVPTVAATLTYRGDELYLDPINWNGPQPMMYTSDRKKLDFGTLKFSSVSGSGFSKYGRQHNWYLPSEADKIKFRQFLGRRQGVARPVWMPSGVNDFTLAVNAVSTDSFITVKPNSYDTLVAQHPARRDIIIHLNNGTYLCRRILNSSTGAQGTLLTLDAAVGVTINMQDVKRISYLTWYRLASPAVTIRHLTDTVATVDAALVARRPKGT